MKASSPAGRWLGSVAAALGVWVATQMGIAPAQAQTPAAATAATATQSAAAAAPGSAGASDARAEQKACLACHSTGHKVDMSVADGKSRTLASVPPDAFASGQHAALGCTTCHKGADNPAQGQGHNTPSGKSIRAASCVDCHTDLWDKARKAGQESSKPRLGTVALNIEAYEKSFHARPDKNNPSRPMAGCENCHSTHTFNVPPADSPQRAAWRVSSMLATCDKSCHEDQHDTFVDSVHGKALIGKKDAKAAVCSDCHTAHAVRNTSGEPFKLAVTASCGSCHNENYKSYKATYHGKISTLGYGYVAKCFDCHGSHGVLAVKDPASKVHPDNRMETCKECHNGKKAGLAPVGFATFQPHAVTDDFKRYPQVWLGWKMMVGLLVGTFGFFWLHTALWFYRELQERKAGKTRPAVAIADLPPELRGKHWRRFSPAWRLGHILFAVSLMLLTFTGMPMFYPDAAWAPWVIKLLGGPRVAGLIHRANALVFAGVFFWHLIYIAVRIWKNRSTFRWFGPDSLIPNLQDLNDIVAMFKWFVGTGPRPVFDRWTYWEKFDYWAPFWGVTIIGVSGLMMWLPHITGSYLPGWVFNVAAIFHGEEAFLAVVFLFTVHFFNNHFRPEKFPVETVMFTGSMSLEHIAREHPLEYQRIKASGELDKYIVDAPSAPMTLMSKMLGFILIFTGLVLLFGVAVGFFGGH